MNWTRNREVVGSIPDLAQWVGDPALPRAELWCGSQTQLDPALLWLWHRPVAIALIGPLAWESPYARGAALEKEKKKKKKKNLLVKKR